MKTFNVWFPIATLLLQAGLGSSQFAGAKDSSKNVAMSLPKVLDERLELSLWAADPDIVTPIGIAIDEKDRIFVLESHTHSPPSGYQGPHSDRIKIFSDTNGDGRMDSASVFAEGFDDGMNLEFSEQGVLYLVEKKSVWALYDRDNDGVSDDRKRILQMVEPDRVYDHAGLLGIAFSEDGWMYISRGNVGGSYWKLKGTDGSTIDGYGDGGNIVRCRMDGSDLHEVATGFWNPFGLMVDNAGRVLATDNDPDSRGPNRLLHIIMGGDYGYKALYGGSGVNPYLSWNGELPGTLPYIVGLGESPTGLLEAGIARLPEDYAKSVLVAVWEESNIVKVDLEPKGSSLSGSITPLIEGGQDFRPISFAVDSKGDIFFTDWVKRVYPNHGLGRIWRLATRDRSIHATGSKLQPSQELEELRSIYLTKDLDDISRLVDGFSSSDPFVRTASMAAAQNPVFQERLVGLLSDPEDDIRLGALLTLQRSGIEVEDNLLRPLLSDSDLRIRKMALIWAGQSGMTSLRDDLVLAISSANVTADLLDTYLETLRHLDPAFIEGVANRIGRRELPPRRRHADLKSGLLADESTPIATRTALMRFLDVPEEFFDVVAPLTGSGKDPELRMEAVRTIARISTPEAAGTLLGLAKDRDNPSNLRAEAVFGLAKQSGDVTSALVGLLEDPNDAVRIEAARALRSKSLSNEETSAIRKVYRSLSKPAQSRLGQQLAMIVDSLRARSNRPTTVNEWETALSDRDGDPEAGRRVFFSLQSQCVSCHVVDNIGGIIGPNLTNIGASKSREQLVRSILEPSAEIAPDWQGWFVRTADGRTHYGRQIDVKGESTVVLMNLNGQFEEYRDAESWGVSEASLMPDGLENNFTEEDFADLITYLEKLQ